MTCIMTHNDIIEYENDYKVDYSSDTYWVKLTRKDSLTSKADGEYKTIVIPKKEIVSILFD